VTVTIRRAERREAGALSELALRSKAYWGYDARFLAACRAELSVHPADIERRRVTVAEDGGWIVGFYALRGASPEGELSLLFVEPDRIGTGIGRMLWQHCVVTAARVGLWQIRIESDPFAEGFYTAMGAVLVGDAASHSIPDRRLPLLSFDMSTVPIQLHRVEELAMQIEAAVADLRAELHRLVPDGQVEHVGATSLPNGVTKGDLDVNLRVPLERFDEAVATLSASFEAAQPQNWTATFASYADDRCGLPVGIQVTARGSDEDFLVAARDRLRADPALRHRYDELKQTTAPAGRAAYWQAKNDFLRELGETPPP
jgi:GrpB-like predicted nucleotidyltransferase (UPF0157 family)/N-acetylglutamate synthase-like GNAT family acetyltransferase